LRTARRNSLCLDDAQDAYQRALEIFMGNAERLDSARAAAWLHVVVKREAQAIRRARQRLVTTEEVDLDAHESVSQPTRDERLLTFDMLTRSTEALQRLKPQELRALWLKAQGHSYSDIGAIRSRPAVDSISRSRSRRRPRGLGTDARHPFARPVAV
jgi:hypothetical protein